MANDLQTNIDLIDEFTKKLQVAVIGAEETTKKHETWVEGTADQTIPTAMGPMKTLRGLIAEWRLTADQAVSDSIDNFDQQFVDKLEQFDIDFVNYLLTVGFEPAVIYRAGITIERRSQTVAYDGVTYYWGGDLPLAISGDFENEDGWLIAPLVGGIEIPQMTFATGGTIVRKTQSVMGSDGEWYFWTGSFPKIVAPGSTLESSGGVGVNAFKTASGNVPLRPLMKIVATAAGVVLNEGSFEFGATITSSSQVLAEFGNGRIWKWDGPIPKVVNMNSTPSNSGGVGLNLWNEVTTATGTSGAGITISDNPPTGVGSGHRWYCTTDGRTYIRYADGDSVQWVEESPQGSVFDGMEPRVREALRRTYAEAGLNLAAGSFEAGGTLTSASDVLLHEASGKAYGWGGAFPKLVGAGSAVSGFVDKSDTSTLVFNSVADMKVGVAALGVVGMHVMWLGYYSSGDGGGNNGVIKSGAHTDDGGRIFSIGDSVYVQAELSMDINGRLFGAKFAGGYDDQPHIAKAFAALGVRGAVKLSGNPTFKSTLEFPKQARGMRLYADALTNVTCAHNGDGILMEFDNENYGRCVIENIQLSGPNAVYPPDGYIPPSTGAGIRMRTAYDNTFINVIVYGFDVGLFLNRGFNNKTVGNCEFQFNQTGIYLYNSIGATNVNNFSKSKIRENRQRGVVLDGSGGASPITQNYFRECYIESNSKWAGSAYVSGGPGDGSWSVAVVLISAYENNFDNCYMENHEYSMWLQNQSSNNSLRGVRHDYSADLTRRGKIKIKGQYCLNNVFDGQIYSSNDRAFPHVESDHATQTGSFTNCIGLNFIKSSVLGKFTTGNNMSFGFSGGTPDGTIYRPDQGYTSNPIEGTTSGRVQGIGTNNATLHCAGLSEVSLQSAINAPTTITTFSGLKAGQIFVLWNYQNTQPITIKNNGPLGNIVLTGSTDVVLAYYSDMLVFWVNGLGRAVEIGRRIN